MKKIFTLFCALLLPLQGFSGPIRPSTLPPNSPSQNGPVQVNPGQGAPAQTPQNQVAPTYPPRQPMPNQTPPSRPAPNGNGIPFSPNQGNGGSCGPSCGPSCNPNANPNQGALPTVISPCSDIPFCTPGPGDYPTAPCHGTGCALTVAAMALPFIIIAGVAAVILTVSDPQHSH